MNGVGRNIRQQEALPVERTLPHNALTQRVLPRFAVERIGEARELLEQRRIPGALHDVHHALLRIDQRGQFGQQHLSHRDQVARPPASCG